MDFSTAYSWANLRFLFEGLWVTIEVTVLSILMSLAIGILLGVIRYMKIPVLSKVVALIIDVTRNLPLLLIIFFVYFFLPQIGISFDVFWASTVAMTIFESAMISEIVRGGLTSIPTGQTEAGLAAGLSHWQVLGLIILPQALRHMRPSIVSQLIALIKDTNLATIIALPELTHNARIIYGQNNAYIFPMFVLITLMYWILCYGLSRFSDRLARQEARS